MNRTIIVNSFNYPHTHAFDEIANAFEDALPGGLKRLVFGSHLLKTPSMCGDIAYQTEQIRSECNWVSKDYVNLLRTCEVWDYSRENIKALKTHGINAKFVPIRYMPCMTKFTSLPDSEKDIDVLFYGSTNARRIKILNDLRAAGVKTSKIFNVYGAERDAYIARSKIVLNMHFFENGIFEIFRCAHLFAHSKCVVSEFGCDSDLDTMYGPSAVLSYTKDIVETCLKLLHDDKRRRDTEIEAFENFKTPTLAESLK